MSLSGITEDSKRFDVVESHDWPSFERIWHIKIVQMVRGTCTTKAK